MNMEYEPRSEALQHDRLNLHTEINPFSQDIVMYQMRPIIELAAHDIDSVYIYSTNITTSDRRRFASEQLLKPSPELQLKLVLYGMYEQSPEDLNIDEFLYDAAAKYKVELPNNAVESLDIYERGQEVIELRSNDIVSALEYVMGEHRDHEYIVLKLLAKPAREIVEDRHLILLQDMTIAGAAFESPDLYGELKAKLEVGEYDPMIAKDVLLEVSREDYSTTESKVREEIRRMIGLAKNLAPESDESTILETICNKQNLQYWPIELNKYIDQRRELLAASLKNRFENRRSFMQASGYIPCHKDVKDLEQLLRLHPEFSSDTRELTKAEQVRQNVERRRKRTQTGNLGKAALKKSAQTRVESTPQLRMVTMMDKQGNEFNEDSEEFGDMLKTFFESHKGVDLETTARDAIAYIKDPVKSNGLSRGVRVLTDAVVSIGEDGERKEKYKLFRLRPDQAPGVETPNKLSSKMRVFFVINKEDNNKVHILGFAIKDNARRFFRSFGIKAYGEK